MINSFCIKIARLDLKTDVTRPQVSLGAVRSSSSGEILPQDLEELSQILADTNSVLRRNSNLRYIVVTQSDLHASGSGGASQIVAHTDSVLRSKSNTGIV